MFPVYLCVEEWFEQACVLHLSCDVRPPQSESRSSSKHLQVALFTESRQEAGAEPAAAANNRYSYCKQQVRLLQSTGKVTEICIDL